MVAVRVREGDPPDRPAERGGAGEDQPVRAGQAGVDQREPILFRDEVLVDDAQPGEAVRARLARRAGGAALELTSISD